MLLWHRVRAGQRRKNSGVALTLFYNFVLTKLESKVNYQIVYSSILRERNLWRKKGTFLASSKGEAEFFEAKSDRATALEFQSGFYNFVLTNREIKINSCIVLNCISMEKIKGISCFIEGCSRIKCTASWKSKFNRANKLEFQSWF